MEQAVKRQLVSDVPVGVFLSGGIDSSAITAFASRHYQGKLATYSVGFDSTVNRIASFAEDLKTTGRTHNRVLVMEVFGRYAGHTAFRSGIAAETDAILVPEIPVNFAVLYDHCKERYFSRVEQSDVNASTYMIIVAEGLRSSSGEELVDESAGVDAFGHKKLAGAGKYVCNELIRRFKEDPSVADLMKRSKLYVNGIYEIPEVRSVAPGHLVRCGRSSVYDVNFGKEAGAAAVILLKSGLSGVTVSGIQNGKIQYMKTSDAIEQRFVDLNVVTLHEQLGTCFGREPQEAKLKAEQKKGQVERYL